MAIFGVGIKRGILGESEKLAKSHFWEYGDRWQQGDHFSGPPKKRPNFRTPENKARISGPPKIGRF